MSTSGLDALQKGITAKEPVYKMAKPVRKMTKPLTFIGVFLLVIFFFIATDSAPEILQRLWTYSFALWFYFSICFSISRAIGVRYINKNAWQLPSLLSDMEKSYDLEEYFQSRDELIKYLCKMARWENYKSALNSKPTVLLAELETTKTESINNAIRRSAAHCRDLTRKHNSSFAEILKDDIYSYRGRLNDENMAVYEECYKSVASLAQVVGTIDEVDIMSGNDFEHWCADLLAHNGFTNVIVTQASGDQGVDVTATKGGVKYAVQCKCYSSDLGNTPVQEVYAGKAMYECQVGIVMTNRYFTAGAKTLAAKTGVLLWDRDKLIELMANKI